ncbi:MAG: hypothetical protein DHS20C17_19330 [Cyclobacteriaceae bacterium]|nr:MAG: hypothetical protein DHS20C17_19330 [Cyclobacteriaceae bacterium]
MKLVTGSLLAVLLVCCTKNQKVSESDNLGYLQHHFTISEPAQPGFEKGLLLLHSFEYEDAREAFQEARQADPEEVMAYWGEAMSYYKALWGLQDVDAGRATMKRLGETPEARLARTENELEYDFWKGVELLYGEGEFNQRNVEYAKHMADLYDKYPGNQEVAAFYALGLMWSVPLGRDAEVFNKSAQVVAGILEENPSHPGALHYMIHAYDDPEYAQFAIDAANLYSKVAPDATHALHMPSHIYLALGMWDDVVASNEASYQASVDRLTRKGLGDDARGYHSYFWLQYGYLQQQRQQDAHKLLKDMAVYVKKAPTQQARSYWIDMINAYLTDAPQWENDIEAMVVSRQDLGMDSKAGHRFFFGRRAYMSNDMETLELHMDSLEVEIGQAELVVTADGITLCSAGTTRYAPNRSDIDRAQVIWHQLDAFRSSLKNEEKAVESALVAATELEQSIGYSFGPPDIPYPSFEQYGYWLLDQGRADDALTQFDKGLERTPNRTNALYGKLAALRALGRDQQILEVQAIIDQIVKVAPENMTNS